jgi:ferredoxin
MPKLIHYRDKCIGCGICQEMQPDIWRMSKKDGKATLLQSTIKKGVSILRISESVKEQSKQTVKACPVHIIKLS